MDWLSFALGFGAAFVTSFAACALFLLWEHHSRPTGEPWSGGVLHDQYTKKGK